MSGIVGFVYQKEKMDLHASLSAMMKLLAHRAQDGEGHWSAGQVGLGHLRLRTTPEEVYETLPLRAANDRLVLTADLRLDNREELLDRLGMRDRPSAEVSDHALLLAAYEQWGAACPHYLLGDFAFALWDTPKQQLFCVRDHLGVKPFYYYHDSCLFAFASEIKALFCLPEVPRQVNELRVAEFLAWQESEDKRETFYQQIMRLPPGHSLTVQAGQVRLQPYWQLDPTRELSLASDAAYLEQFSHLFHQAVRCRLRGERPIGSILSGGLDSSAVTCVARQELGGERALHTLSTWFSGENGEDERPFIDAIIEQGGVEQGTMIPHRVDGNQLTLSGETVRRILWHQDEPFYYSFLLALWPLYAIAQQQGVRILLDGSDGDSVVAHSRDGYLLDLLCSGRYGRFVTEIDGWARHDGLHGLPYLRRWISQLWHKGRALGALQRQAGGGAGRWYGASLDQGFRHLIHPDLLRRTHLLERMAEREATIQRATTSCARQAHYRRLEASAFPYHLEMLNRAAAAFGLVYRHPFFDKRLVEFCLALPAAQKFQRGQTRSIMRRALRSQLPPAIYARIGKGHVKHRYVARALVAEPAALHTAITQNPALAQFVQLPAWWHIWCEAPATVSVHATQLWYISILSLWLNDAMRMG